jgi:hypothetical protein
LTSFQIFATIYFVAYLSLAKIYHTNFLLSSDFFIGSMNVEPYKGVWSCIGKVADTKFGWRLMRGAVA